MASLNQQEVKKCENYKLQTKRQAFTLIELMVVMAIIAVLVTLIVGAISIARRSARDTQRRENIKTIMAYLEDYYASKRFYPSNYNNRFGVPANPNGSWDHVCNASRASHLYQLVGIFPRDKIGDAGFLKDPFGVPLVWGNNGDPEVEKRWSTYKHQTPDPDPLNAFYRYAYVCVGGGSGGGGSYRLLLLTEALNPGPVTVDVYSPNQGWVGDDGCGGEVFGDRTGCDPSRG